MAKPKELLFHFLSRPMRLLRVLMFWQKGKPSSRKTIFIVGTPRSGTTLLRSILTAHSQLGGSYGESSGIFALRDIFEYNTQELDSRLLESAKAKSAHLIEFYDTVTQGFLDLRKKQIFVDKLTVQPYRLRYVAKNFPNSLFVQIVRDGRDCYCSALKHPNVPQKSSIQRFAKYWKFNFNAVKKMLPEERLYTFRYEDMTEDPEKEVSALMNFLGLSFEAGQIAPSIYSRSSQMSKRDVHKNLNKPINSSSQQRWKKELSESEKTIFLDIAKKELDELGYETYARANS